jgi:hypothetical protein
MKLSNDEQNIAVVELMEKNILHLPDNLVSGLHTGERFIVLRNGDTLLLKRIQPARITDIVAKTPPSEPPLTMEEIHEIVHEVRRHHASEEM